MVQIKQRRVAEKAFTTSMLPEDFSAHGALNTDDNPYQYNFFKCQNDMLTVLARRMGFDLSMITIKLGGNDLNEEERLALAQTFQNIAQSTLRRTDRMFDIRFQDSQINIVLPGTKADKAQVVINKLRSALQDHRDKMMERGKLTFSVETLHEIAA